MEELPGHGSDDHHTCVPSSGAPAANDPDAPTTIPPVELFNLLQHSSIDVVFLVLTNADVSTSVISAVGFTETTDDHCNFYLPPAVSAQITDKSRSRLLLLGGDDVAVASLPSKFSLLVHVVAELRATAELPPLRVQLVDPSFASSFRLHEPPSVNLVPTASGWIFLGNSADAVSNAVVRDLQIDCVVNCSSSSQDKPFGHVEYFDLSVSREDPEAGTFNAFDDAVAFIATAFETHARLLVHSTYGRSRCCMLVVYYIMKTEGASLVDAYHRVLKARPGMMPRDAILGILLAKARALHGPSNFDGDEGKPRLRDLTRGELLAPEALAAHRAAVAHLNAAELRQLAAKQRAAAASREPSSFATNTFVLTSTAEATAETRRRVVPETSVSCRWLFNRLQSGTGMLLLDTRERAAFEDDSIPTAISVPPPADEGRRASLAAAERSLLPEQAHLFTAKKRKLREVVLYGDTPRLPKPWTRQLGGLLVAEGVVSSVRYLDDGFTTFYYRYPFYTTQFLFAGQNADEGLFLARTQSGTHNINYPNELLDGFLFLGNMWHAQSSSVVRNLGITHIINASLDTGNVFESAGVAYHEVKIKDDIYANIAAHFEPTFQFIERAKQTQHSRVLIHCTQGISRSATLAIYYLMRAQRWSLVTAVNYCIANRGVCFPNQGFLQALMVAERQLYQANTVLTHELDALLECGLPDQPVPKPAVPADPASDEGCHLCTKPFSFFEWRHRCGLCRRVVCAKCSGSRLLLSDKADVGRVCDHCLVHLYTLHLPLPFRLNVRLLFADGPRRKTLSVKSPCLQHQVLTITYVAGTEAHVLLELLRKRFQVRAYELLDVTGDGVDLGADWSLHATAYLDLPDHAVLFASIGESGSIRPPAASVDLLSTRRSRSFSEGRGPPTRNLARLHHHSSPGSRGGKLRLSAAPVALDITRFQTLWTTAFPRHPDVPLDALLELDPEMLAQVMLGLSAMQVAGADAAVRLHQLPLNSHARAFLGRYLV
ncbi:dual specificity phosphatase [Achlya hypogyna]|uniref:Dual specificity phosphatase n=1 Tax=Achlya hypogyna TaxID=1202772 RepID=A0A1V9YHH2_ACHHY|nr:dual specificity phosphatase [Achlya hypogyna]